MMWQRALAVATVFCVVTHALTSCVPDFEDTPYLVDEARILAVRGIPAEARPNTQVRYEVLVAGPGGMQTLALDYAYCTAGRRAEERTGVSSTCLEGDALSPIGQSATLFPESCSRFGPNAPPSVGDEPPRRAADPDATGGYYVPVRVVIPGEPKSQSFGFHRVRCDLAGATRDIFDAFEDGYKDNQHPQVASLRAAAQNADISMPATNLIDQERSVSPGASMSFQLEVRADSFEDYIVYSAENAALNDRKEKLRVNWYISDGTLDHFSQEISQLTRLAQNTWTAPTAPGIVHGWLVLSDERGGSSWTAFRLLVQ